MVFARNHFLTPDPDFQDGCHASDFESIIRQPNIQEPKRINHGNKNLKRRVYQEQDNDRMCLPAALAEIFTEAGIKPGKDQEWLFLLDEEFLANPRWPHDDRPGNPDE